MTTGEVHGHEVLRCRSKSRGCNNLDLKRGGSAKDRDPALRRAEPTRKETCREFISRSDYRSYHTNEEWLTRDQLAEVFKTIGSAVPDLRWTIRDIQTSGDQIVVRGEATGTPTGEFWGAKPTGNGFKTMSIDLFTVKNGKLASAYHVENWITALQQIGK